MSRLDLRCNLCHRFYGDQQVPMHLIENHEVAIPCECGSPSLMITWETGEAPKGFVHPKATDSVGAIWDKAGLDPTSEKSKKATTEHIKKTKKKVR